MNISSSGAPSPQNNPSCWAVVVVALVVDEFSYGSFRTIILGYYYYLCYSLATLLMVAL